MTIKQKNMRIINILRSLMDGTMHLEIMRDRMKIGKLIGKPKVKPAVIKPINKSKLVINCSKPVDFNRINTDYY